VSGLIIVAPRPIAGITASRGADAANLFTRDPREVWRDADSGSAVQFRIDLGEVQLIDTIFLGHATPLEAATTWTLRGGLVGYQQNVIQAQSGMRVQDSATSAPRRSHGLWHGPPIGLRYLEIELSTPAGSPPIAIGSLMIGKAFAPKFNKEWGAGRGVLDTGRATRLANGGFAIVDGVRRGSYSWSFGDLSQAEVDALYEIQLQCGETAPVLVVEDPVRSVGLYHRIHYAKFASLKPYRRRNPAQTRWELEVEQWG